MLSSVACLDVLYFSTLFHKRQDFRKEKIAEIKICFDFLYKFVWNISRSIKNSERYYKFSYVLI